MLFHPGNVVVGVRGLFPMNPEFSQVFLGEELEGKVVFRCGVMKRCIFLLV